MKLKDVYASGRFGLSFELFPPKTDAKEAELFAHLGNLLRFEPDYITCTYGAGGSTRAKTLDIITRVKSETGIPVASHLTCVGSTKAELRKYLQEARDRGVDYIVALRGDPPRGQTEFVAVADGLRYASELVGLVRQDFPDFGIAVAGYPEVHREAVSPADDLLNLQRKVEAGGDAVITQLFYDNDDFFRFKELYEQAGIRAPLVPGILPVTNYAQVQRIANLCGAKLPAQFVADLQACGDDAAAQFKVGVDFAVRQVQALVDAGAPGLHFYVLNQSEATSQLLKEVKLPARTSV